MPLRYSKDSAAHSVYFYPDKSQLNGPGVEQDIRLVTRVDGQLQYIGLSRDLNHETASHMRVYYQGEIFALLHYSEYVVGEISG